MCVFDGHVCVGTILHISGHTCLCMWRSKVMSGIIPDHSFIHWGWVSLSNPEFAYMANLASQLPVEILHLLVSEAVITVRPPCLPEMYGFLETKLLSPCLNGKCFSNWAITLTPNLFFFVLSQDVAWARQESFWFLAMGKYKNLYEFFLENERM